MPTGSPISRRTRARPSPAHDSIEERRAEQGRHRVMRHQIVERDRAVWTRTALRSLKAATAKMNAATLSAAIRMMTRPLRANAPAKAAAMHRA